MLVLSFLFSSYFSSSSSWWCASALFERFQVGCRVVYNARVRSGLLHACISAIQEHMQACTGHGSVYLHFFQMHRCLCVYLVMYAAAASAAKGSTADKQAAAVRRAPARRRKAAGKC
jgi:hypothetical protein